MSRKGGIPPPPNNPKIQKKKKKKEKKKRVIRQLNRINLSIYLATLLVVKWLTKIFSMGICTFFDRIPSLKHT